MWLFTPLTYKEMMFSFPIVYKTFLFPANITYFFPNPPPGRVEASYLVGQYFFGCKEVGNAIQFPIFEIFSLRLTILILL